MCRMGIEFGEELSPIPLLYPPQSRCDSSPFPKFWERGSLER